LWITQPFRKDILAIGDFYEVGVKLRGRDPYLGILGGSGEPGGVVHHGAYDSPMDVAQGMAYPWVKVNDKVGPGIFVKPDIAVQGLPYGGLPVDV